MRPSTRTSLSVAACLLGLLCLLAVGAAGLQVGPDGWTNTTQPQAAGDLELPERVVLPGDRTSGSTTVGVDGTAALDRSGTRLDGAYNRYLLEARLDAAETDAAEQSVLNGTVASMNRSLADLADREQSARRAFRSGEITADAYLAEQRAIHEQANQLEQLADRIDPLNARRSGLVDQYAASNVSSHLGTLWGDIIAHRGPVRSDLSEIVAGNQDPRRIQVTASPNGTVLTTISDGAYHREAYRSDLLVSGSERGIGPAELGELVTEELYSHFEANYDFSSVGQGISRQLYLVLSQGDYYENGVLRSYVDAVSESVFWEYQRMDLDDDLPVGPAITTADGDVNVSVRSTYPTGPAAVDVTTNGSALADVPVSVNGTTIGQTGDDGRIWVVLPHGSPTVSATVAGQPVDVPIEWEAEGAVPGGNQTSTGDQTGSGL